MIHRKDVFKFSQYYWWDYWSDIYSFYNCYRYLFKDKLLNRTVDPKRYQPRAIRRYALKRETKFLNSTDKSHFKYLDDVRYSGNYKTCVTSDTIYIANILKKIVGSITGVPRIY